MIATVTLTRVFPIPYAENRHAGARRRPHEKV
jgi:hypothetical protein